MHNCNKLISLPHSICFCKNLQKIKVSTITILTPSMILLEKLNEIQIIFNDIIHLQNINDIRLQWKKHIIMNY